MRILRNISLVPWWLACSALRLNQHDKGYDWSLAGLVRNPSTRRIKVLGWLFWGLVAAGVWWVL
jgi:hypothetical protein